VTPDTPPPSDVQTGSKLPNSKPPLITWL
jgi:hypothetical protein